jgi:hypothetical protein
LSDGVFGSGFDLPFKTPDFFFEIDRARIDADSDGESRGTANRVVSLIKPVIELVDHICQTD